MVVDFGTARDLENPHIKGSGNGRPGKFVYEHFVGTPQYMPIEMIRNKGSDLRSDIWAFGIILFQMISGDFPFKGKSEYLIFKAIQEHELAFEPLVFPEEAQSLILKILQKDPEKRPTLSEIRSHPFFADWKRKKFSEIVPTGEERELYRIRRTAKNSPEMKRRGEAEKFYSEVNVEGKSEWFLAALKY